MGKKLKKTYKNGMYLYAFLLFWSIAVVFNSSAALLVASSVGGMKDDFQNLLSERSGNSFQAGHAVPRLSIPISISTPKMINRSIPRDSAILILAVSPAYAVVEAWCFGSSVRPRESFFDFVLDSFSPLSYFCLQWRRKKSFRGVASHQVTWP